MKYIILDESDDSIFFEYGECRAIKSNNPIHLCITGFTDGISRAPTRDEIDSIVNLVFTDEDKIIPNIRAKMFSDEAVHIWEDTPFTRELLNI